MNQDPVIVIVVGAGLAGLSCAVRLHEAGHPVKLYEAASAVGGRVRTDLVDGFLLDRGFQVYLDAYPQAGNLLDLDALELNRFEPGASIWKNGKLHQVIDVFRRPQALLTSAVAPIGSVGDKLRIARLRARLLQKSIDDIWESNDQPTEAYLKQLGFSERIIDDFFRGFYGGIFLEDRLHTSSRMFEFTYKMFSTGYATLPANGIQAIPDQLAARLPSQAIHLESPVQSVSAKSVVIDGIEIKARHVVVATDGSAANRLIPEIPEPIWHSTSCLYFAADKPPVNQPLIVLKGDRNSLINNLSVPSLVSPKYAPKGQALISLSVLGDQTNNQDLDQQVQQELVEWFGPSASQWQHLRTQHIRKSLPASSPPAKSKYSDIWVCGDHTRNSSIEAAIQTGLDIADQLV